jgi:hypothetical protein
MRPASCDPVRNHCPLAARRPVDAAADEVEDLRHVLHLIQDGGQAHVVEKPLRVVAKSRHGIGILEQMVAGLGKEVSQQAGLPCPSRSRQHHRREAPRGQRQGFFQLTTNVSR